MTKITKPLNYLLLILSLFSLCSCSFQSTSPKFSPKRETITQEPNEDDFIEPYVDNNPITIGLYINKNNTRTLTTTYQSPLTMYQDIVSLEAYYTQEPTLLGNQKNLWQQYYTTYQEITPYRIGYQISFQTTSTTITKTILSPQDVASIFDYIQIYLYDDINQENSWYDHLTEEEITPNTLLTSLKLTASTNIAEITSDITVTVFTYDEDDFDESGNYRGNSSYSVTITKL